jgi:hypothetical protein
VRRGEGEKNVPKYSLENMHRALSESVGKNISLQKKQKVDGL